MMLTQEVIDKIQLAMTHTKMNGETNWKDGDEIDKIIKEYKKIKKQERSNLSQVKKMGLTDKDGKPL